MEIQEQVTTTRTVYVAPCVKCGSEDVTIDDCGYSSFNVGGGKCKSCGHSVTSSIASCFPTKKELARIWNFSNDKNQLIQQAEARIAKDQALIESLSK